MVDLELDVFTAFAKCRHAYHSRWATLQGAAYAGSICVGSRFVDNGDSTVTDRLSNLTWEKKVDDLSERDKDNEYTWSTGSPFKETGTVFTTFLNTVNDGAFAGVSGWRLPTLAELQTIVLDFPCRGQIMSFTCSCPASPCIDPALDAANTGGDRYWSTTPYLPVADLQWAVQFANGGVSAAGRDDSNFARSVRGGL